MLPNPVEYVVFDGKRPMARPYAYVLAGDGLHKVSDTKYFRVSVPLFFTRVSGLPHYPESGASLGIERIPSAWLYRVYHHAKNAGCGELVLRPVEQMYHFHWLGAGWRVALPRQKAGRAQVSYQGGDEASIVLDLHSHHAMSAQFSSIDNDDELGCRFYAVIGRLFTRPEIRVRVGVYGDFMRVDPLVLFDGLGPFVEAV